LLSIDLPFNFNSYMLIALVLQRKEKWKELNHGS